MMPWCSWRRAHLRSWASRWPAMTQQAMHRMIRDALSSTIFLARTLMHPPRPSRVLSGRRVWTAIRTGAVNVVVLVKDADMRKFRLKTLEVFPPEWEVCSRTRSLEIPLRRLNLRQKPVAALYFVLVRSHTHFPHKFADSSYTGSCMPSSFVLFFLRTPCSRPCQVSSVAFARQALAAAKALYFHVLAQLAIAHAIMPMCHCVSSFSAEHFSATCNTVFHCLPFSSSFPL